MEKCCHGNASSCQKSRSQLLTCLKAFQDDAPTGPLRGEFLLLLRGRTSTQLHLHCALSREGPGELSPRGEGAAPLPKPQQLQPLAWAGSSGNGSSSLRLPGPPIPVPGMQIQSHKPVSILLYCRFNDRRRNLTVY